MSAHPRSARARRRDRRGSIVAALTQGQGIAAFRVFGNVVPEGGGVARSGTFPRGSPWCRWGRRARPPCGRARRRRAPGVARWGRRRVRRRRQHPRDSSGAPRVGAGPTAAVDIVEAAGVVRVGVGLPPILHQVLGASAGRSGLLDEPHRGQAPVYRAWWLLVVLPSPGLDPLLRVGHRPRDDGVARRQRVDDT